MLAACLITWCLAGSFDPQFRASYAQSVIDKHGYTTRMVLGELDPVAVIGFVEQPGRNAFVVGSLPLQLRIGDRFRVSVGGLASTAAIPVRGTHLNFAIAALLDLLKHVTLSYLHSSNGGLSRANPSINAFGIGLSVLATD